jgi:AraC-like DNA-binding protein
MRPALSVDDFMAAPLDHYLLGRNWLVWCHDPSLCGVVIWDRPGEADAEALLQVLDIGHCTAMAAQLDLVVDTRRLVGVDLGLFARFAEYARDGGGENARLRRQAIVRADGLVGAVTAGFHPVAETRHAWSIFGDSASAFAWLERAAEGEGAAAAGLPPGEARSLAAVRLEVERIVDEARGSATLVRSLQEHLAQNIDAPRVQKAARALGLSSRSLQRELLESGTTFRAEVARVRVGRAELLLAETDLKVAAIANEVGCASLPHFISLFRRVRQTSPGRFRARARRALRGDDVSNDERVAPVSQLAAG